MAIDRARLARLQAEAKARLEDERMRPDVLLSDLDDVLSTLRDQRTRLTRYELEALRLQADVLFRLLAKVMPDLKAVEVEALNQARVEYNFAVGKKPAPGSGTSADVIKFNSRD